MNQSLQSIISKNVIKSSFAWILVIFIALFLVSIVYITKKNNEIHSEKLENKKDAIENVLENAKEKIGDLASNHLIINSIVDYSSRDNYLPIFFRSLKVFDVQNESIVFVDFSGEVITGKNSDLFSEVSGKFDWQVKVLENGNNYFSVSHQGLFIVYPVMVSNFTEGAIVYYIESIQQIIPNMAESIVFAYLSDNDTVLYSSDIELVKLGSQFKHDFYSFWYKKVIDVENGQLISLEPPLIAYSRVLWGILVTLISLITIYLALISIVNRTAKYAANSMEKLHQDLLFVQKNEKIVPLTNVDQQEPQEFVDIRKSFNDVLGDLFSKNISLANFTSMVNSINDIIVVVDNDKKVMLYNLSFELFYQRAGFSPPYNLSNILADKLLINTEKEVVCYDFCCPEDNSLNCSIEWDFSPYVDQKGNIQGTVIIGKDISLSRQLELELLIKNKAFESSQSAALIASTNGKETQNIYINESFIQLFGFGLNEALEKHCLFMCDEENSSAQLSMVNSAIWAGEACTGSFHAIKKDGTDVIVELTLSPITNAQNETTHYLGIFTDVTAREKAQEYLKLAKSQAEESSKLKSEFLASMSHEIRTPMNGVLGMLGILLDTELSDEQKQHVLVAQKSATSLLAIINDILDFSKIEAGKLDIEQVVCDIYSLFGDVISTHATKAKEKNIQLVLDMTSVDFSLIQTDPVRLQQILNNLIGNAIKFTNEGQVVVTAKVNVTGKTTAKLTCTVKDSGIGMTADAVSKVFESFSQADSSTTRNFGGTGLGLTITKKLCHMLDGDIIVSSVAGKGSTFEFHISINIAEHNELYVPVLLQDKNISLCGLDFTNSRLLHSQLSKWGANVCIIDSNQVCADTVNPNSADLYIIGIESSEEFTALYAASDVDQTSCILFNDSASSPREVISQNFEFDAVLQTPVTMEALTRVLNATLHQDELESIELFVNLEETVPNDSLRILLVEDNRTNQLVAKKVLSEFSDEIEIANNGQEALDILLESDRKFSLVFMDCQMPVLDGYQTTEGIRAGKAGENYKQIPIIAMTANAIKGDREKCLRHGMSDYVSKPINLSILREKVEKWSGI